VKFKGLL